MAKLTINGQPFETRNSTYGYYDGEPCKIMDLLGDFDAWRRPDTVLLQTQSLAGGWVRYWLTSTDEGLRKSMAALAALEMGRPRQRRGLR